MAVDQSPGDPWPSEWLRGVLEVCALRLLADGPTYGYAIATRLAEAGLGEVKGGTLYPLLGRLETAGLVETQWRAGEQGPGRKYFSLTPLGLESLHHRRSQWHAFTTTTITLLDGSSQPPEEETP